MKIAIDGPGGAGKSTIARALARDLGLVYLDTGAMYRCCALKASREGIDVLDAAAVEALMADISLSYEISDQGAVLRLDGEPTGDEIRRPEIAKLASDISAQPACRRRLTAIQREIASRYDVVMDGRDIGTVVLPDAEIKIFLTAGTEERARRRYLEQKAKGVDCSLEDVLKELNDRDRQDSDRPVAPLKQADDAVLLDSDGLTVDEVVARVKTLVCARRGDRSDGRV